MNSSWRVSSVGLLGVSALAVVIGGGALRADPPKPATAPAPAAPTPPTPAPATPAPAAKPVPTAAELALTKALQVEQSLVDALQKVRRYSVSVPISMRDRQNNLRQVGGGSGVLINRAGTLWVVTNVHVVKDAHGIEAVTYDGVSHAMEVEDQIAQYDIALLRFKEKPKNLKGVDVRAAASTALSEGAWVLATGSPFLLAADGQPVCTLGVISGTDRILPSEEFFYGNAIQHDAEVNPGNSGGPLWNSKGELIGINGKISMRPGSQGVAQNTGASFAVPIHLVAGYLDKLVKEGDTHVGFLGVDFETFTDSGTGNPAGARVTAFRPGSPAFGGTEKTNPNALAKDDVITKVSFSSQGSVPSKQVAVLTAADLTNVLVLYPAQTKVAITYRRGKKTLTWSGLLGSN